MAKAEGLPEVYFHIIFDGRSTEPGSAPALLAELDGQLDQIVEGDTFVAELVGQEDGRTLYCTACWTPFMPQVYSFSVTDEPIYGWIVDYEREDTGELAAIRARGVVDCEADEEYDGPYAEQFRQLIQMLAAAASKSGYRTESYDASDDLDDL